MFWNRHSFSKVYLLYSCYKQRAKHNAPTLCIPDPSSFPLQHDDVGVSSFCHYTSLYDKYSFYGFIESRIDVLFWDAKSIYLGRLRFFVLHFLFFLFLFSHFLPCSSGEETPFVQLSNGIGFRTGFSYWCPIKRSLCKHGTASLSRTHLLEYNASLMSQKGRLFLAQFHYNGRKSCWSWMDDGWSGHNTTTQPKEDPSSEGKRPPFSVIFSRTCWTRKKSDDFIDHIRRWWNGPADRPTVARRMMIYIFSLCLIDSTHMYRPSSIVGLLMPFLHPQC